MPPRNMSPFSEVVDTNGLMKERANVSRNMRQQLPRCSSHPCKKASIPSSREFRMNRPARSVPSLLKSQSKRYVKLFGDEEGGEEDDEGRW